jgi:hypothetical protein
VVGVLLFFAVALAFAYVLSAVTLPISVFFRYYSLLFLDRIAPEHGVLGGAASAKPTDERGV